MKENGHTNMEAQIYLSWKAEKSWFTMLRWFQVYRKVIQLYIYVYIYILFQIIFFYRLLQNIEYSSLC